MAHQQAELVNQRVQIHGCQRRFGRSRKIQNPLHDPVEVPELFIHDPGVLRARIVGREFQVERVKQHFHYRERIADFVRDLGRQQAQRGQLFVLAQLLLHVHHPFVEPRPLDGDRRQLCERGKNPNLTVGVNVGTRRVNAERADGVSAEKQWNTQQRNQSLLSRNFDMLVAPGGLHVLHMDGFLAPHHRAQKTFPDTQARLLNVVFAGAKTRAQIQPRPRLIQHHQRAHFRLHQHTRFTGDGVQRLVEVQGGIDCAADTGERLEQARFKPQLLVKPCVLNHPRGLGGERFE